MYFRPVRIKFFFYVKVLINHFLTECIQKSETTLWKSLRKGQLPPPWRHHCSLHTFATKHKVNTYRPPCVALINFVKPRALCTGEQVFSAGVSYLGVWARSSLPLTLHTQARKKLMKQILGTRPVYRHVSNVPTINTLFSSQTPWPRDSNLLRQLLINYVCLQFIHPNIHDLGSI